MNRFRAWGAAAALALGAAAPAAAVEPQMVGTDNRPWYKRMFFAPKPAGPVVRGGPVVAAPGQPPVGATLSPDAVQAAWKAGKPPANADEEAADGPWLATPEGVLKAYRYYNAPAFPARAYARDFGAALADPSAQGYGRMYVTYWETRNLRMAANIREALGWRPGSRMLVIVGASHKGYLDRYLGQMRDVEIEDAAAVLK
jgi:hypothetical protein